MGFKILKDAAFVRPGDATHDYINWHIEALINYFSQHGVDISTATQIMVNLIGRILIEESENRDDFNANVQAIVSIFNTI